MITYSFANVQQIKTTILTVHQLYISPHSILFEPLHDFTVTTACFSQDNLTNEL